MKDFNINTIKSPIAREIINAVLSEKTIKNHVIEHSWTSGCSTEVTPIMLWPDDVEVYVDAQNANYFKNAINRVMAKHPFLFRDGYFSKSDGSCPSCIRFSYANELMERKKEGN